MAHKIQFNAECRLYCSNINRPELPLHLFKRFKHLDMIEVERLYVCPNRGVDFEYQGLKFQEISAGLIEFI